TLPWPFTKSQAAPEHSPDNLERSRNQSDDPKRSLNAFFTHYSTPGISPPSARIDSKLKIQERRPIRPWHLWKYGLLAATK
ncbi:hypothetical protein MPER_15578, partial [Moniliophthora perniciosa FA553]